MRAWLPIFLALASACRCATLPDAAWACRVPADCPPERPACVDGHCQPTSAGSDGGAMLGRTGAGGLSVGPAAAAAPDGRFRAEGAIELPIAGASATSDGGRFQASGGFIQ